MKNIVSFLYDRLLGPNSTYHAAWEFVKKEFKMPQTIKIKWLKSISCKNVWYLIMLWNFWKCWNHCNRKRLSANDNKRRSRLFKFIFVLLFIEKLIPLITFFNSTYIPQTSTFWAFIRFCVWMWVQNRLKLC